MSSIVIVGAGECGGRTALELRRLGYTGSITLIGAERHAPYERPPLSKEGLLSGSPKLIADTADYAVAGVDLLLNHSVVAIDRAALAVVLDDGRRVAYDKLLLATGAAPKQLQHAPVSKRILSLRTHDHAMQISGALRPGSRLAVIGGGFIGLELAATARAMGIQVTVVEGQDRILTRGVPEQLSTILAERHRAEGVKLHVRARITSITEHGSSVAISLAEGKDIIADLIVVGVGSSPNVELALQAGLRVENGIAVDEGLATSDPAIFAAGDCCSFPCKLYGGRRTRLESWRNVQEQAQLVAKSLLGEKCVLSTVPWFWSDQYDLTLQVAGLQDPDAKTIERNSNNGHLIVFQQADDGRILYAAGLGVGHSIARDIRLSEMLIARGKPVSPDLLEDPAVSLKSILSS